MVWCLVKHRDALFYFTSILRTNAMEEKQTLSWSRYSLFVKNTNNHHHVHENIPFVSILSLINTVHNLTVLILFSHLHVGLEFY